MPQTRDFVKFLKQAGVRHVVVFMNKCDLMDDPELLDLVELEIRELLTSYTYNGDNTPFIKGSASKACEDEA